MNCFCGASVNPRWPKCLACDRPLTLPEPPSFALPESAKARRFKVTLTSGQVLLHSRPGGLTRQEAIELSKDWGEVAECVPIACEEGPSGKDVMATPVPLDLTLAAATAGLPITAEQFRSFLSQEDLADIAAGLIPVECLCAYAERFLKRLPAPPAGTLVRCADCAHFERIDHPHAGRCAQGHGWYYLWDTDQRQCEDFEAAVEGRP
jgi:hypothetical protein